MGERECLDAICNTGDGVFVVDANKHIIRWNKGAESILGYPETEVLNRDCFRVISGRVSPERAWCGPNCRVHHSILTGMHQRNFDVQTQTSEGDPLWLNISILSHADAGEPFVAHILRDVTREKKASLALARFLDDLGATEFTPRNIRPGRAAAKNMAQTQRPAADRPPASLSAREIEVLTLLAEGLSTKSLAQKLNISHFTARNHIQNILVKLDLHNKAQAVSYAFKRGLL